LNHSRLSIPVDFPDEQLSIKLSNDQRRNLFLVTKEALNNALKHSNATMIRLSAKINDNRLEFSVRDNGTGITESKKGRASGMKNMLQRMQDIGGNIKWTTLDEGGTEVSYWIII
jgi:signal transduction histidine kinase